MRFSSLLAIATTIGCGSSTPATPDAPNDGFDRNAMLAHLAETVLLPIHADLARDTAALATAVETYCDQLDAGGGTPDAARTAWKTAMVAVDRFDAAVVGPAAMDNKAQRDRIYGWPLLSTCFVDRDTATLFTSGQFDATAKLANAKSLTAVEYLLFNTSTNFTCVNEPPGWSSMSASDLAKTRCRHAAAIAVDVAAAAAEVDTAWRTDGGNFVTELAHAGQSDSSIPTAQEGVNRLSDGMFFVDRMVKDMKLAEPAGIAINACGTVGEPCLIEVEHPFADTTSFAVRTNLRALRETFTGNDGLGFDDFLIGLGHADVATRMTGNLDAAIVSADALPDSFLGALDSDLPKIQATHAAITLFTDDLKSQFLTLLSLEIPDDVAADND